MNFHDETGELTERFKLCAGDDAGAVRRYAVCKRSSVERSTK
jgi:hypothetical protein